MRRPPCPPRTAPIAHCQRISRAIVQATTFDEGAGHRHRGRWRWQYLRPLLLRPLDLAAGVLRRIRLIETVRRDSVGRVNQDRDDLIRALTLLEQPVDDEPNGARAIAAKMPALTVLDQIIEIALLALAALFAALAFRLFRFRRMKLGNDLVEQRIIVGKLGCGLGKGIAGDGDEPRAVTVAFHGHPVDSWGRLLAMHFRAAALADDPQAGAAWRDLDIGMCARDEIACRRFDLAGRGVAAIVQIECG